MLSFKKILICSVLLVIPFTSISTTTAFATQKVEPIQKEDILIDEKEKPTNERSDGSEYVEKVTIDEAINHLEGKAFDIVKFLQVVGKPIVVIAFICSLIISIFGVFGQSKYTFRGFIGMLICGIAYTGIMYSPQIIQYFSSWLSS